MASMTVSRLASAWLPVVAWAALIFTLSSIPDLGTGLGGWDLALRKAAHVAEYGVLGALLFRALSLAGQPFHAASTVARAWLIGAAYAASDELHQHFVPGRQASALDLVFYAVGVAAGALAVRLAHSSRLLRGASTGHCRRSAGRARPPEDGAAESAP
jgi:VanZ family protein